jgi:hypothetical protein
LLGCVWGGGYTLQLFPMDVTPGNEHLITLTALPRTSLLHTYQKVKD